MNYKERLSRTFLFLYFFISLCQNRFSTSRLVERNSPCSQHIQRTSDIRELSVHQSTTTTDIVEARGTKVPEITPTSGATEKLEIFVSVPQEEDSILNQISLLAIQGTVDSRVTIPSLDSTVTLCPGNACYGVSVSAIVAPHALTFSGTLDRRPEKPEHFCIFLRSVHCRATFFTIYKRLTTFCIFVDYVFC